jgi:hypothetical protein
VLCRVSGFQYRLEENIQNIRFISQKAREALPARWAFDKARENSPWPPSRCHLPFDKLTALSKVEGPFDRPFDKSFGRLMIPSHTEGLTVLSEVEGPFDSASFIFGLSQRNRHLIEARS